MSSFNSILTQQDIEYIFTLSAVKTAKNKLDSQESGKVYFTVELTNSIRIALQTHFGLDLTNIRNIPLRWIKGDTLPHIDTGISDFKNTYLVYLNDSPGEFIIGDISYPISKNTGYVFNEGLSHHTLNTEMVPRLLLGPMNELTEPVGAIPIRYYSNFSDAQTETNRIGDNYTDYTVGHVDSGTTGGYTSWRIAPASSNGSSSQLVVYPNGSVLNNDGGSFTVWYSLYPAVPCFMKGTSILCSINGVDTYVPVEKINKDTYVKTSQSGYKKVVMIGYGEIRNLGNDDRTEDRLYKCATTKYPELSTDLYITGCHSILETSITEKQKQDLEKHQGKLYVTENKYRLIACVDERAEPWNSEGTYIVYHIALEHENDAMNYGVYANGGLLVETCSIRTLQNRSNMKLI